MLVILPFHLIASLELRLFFFFSFFFHCLDCHLIATWMTYLLWQLCHILLKFFEFLALFWPFLFVSCLCGSVSQAWFVVVVQKGLSHCDRQPVFDDNHELVFGIWPAGFICEFVCLYVLIGIYVTCDRPVGRPLLGGGPTLST